MNDKEALKRLLGAGPERVEMSSGAVLTVAPFPVEMWSDVQAKALELHPDPDAPTKTVVVLDGTETAPNYEDEGYKEGLRATQALRNAFVMQAVVDLCVDVTPDPKALAKLGKYSKLPEDEGELRQFYLDRWAIRTPADWGKVAAAALSYMTVSDEEVQRRLDFFRRELAGAASDAAATRGT